MDIGLSMSTEFNQDMGTETTLTGNLYYYLVLSSRRLRRLLQTIADYNAIFDSDFFRQYKPSATSFTIVFISSKI